MRVTTFAYPWDLARLGVDRSLQDIAAQGIDAIDLASTYHPIDALSPREGARLFTNARGAVYFPAREQRYRRIKPRLHSPEVCAVWPEVAEGARSLGLDLNAWTVTLFQPWIRDAHPDCARVLPGGDPSGSGVCQANDDVRDYVAALCADLVDQFGVHSIRLEGVIPTTLDLDWLRPRILVRVSPLCRELLALCFCASCIRRATTAGLDDQRVRNVVNEAIATELAEGSPSGAADRVAELTGDAELRAFVVQHVEAAIELVEAAASQIDRSVAPSFATTISTPYSSLLGEAEDDLLHAMIGTVDHAVIYGGNPEHNQRVRAMAARAEPPRDLSLLVTRIRVDVEGGPPKVAPATAAADAGNEFQEASELGVAEVGLYNYGLLRDTDVRRFMTGVESVSSPRTDETGGS
jgi:hypothetical protein